MTLRNFSSTAAETTLAAGVAAANTTLQVSGTTGFPAVPFILAVGAGSAAQELVLVTNVAGTTLTVTRGYDSTVAATHEVGTVVQHSHAALDFREANAHVNAATGVHGLAGSVVGTTDTQGLSNKTVNLGTNTLTGTKAQFNTACTDGDFQYADIADAGVANGTGVDAAGTRAYRRNGSMELNVNATATAALAAGNALFTLPVGYRPPALTFGVVFDTTGPAPIIVNIGTDGVVAVQSAVTSGRILRNCIPVPL